MESKILLASFLHDLGKVMERTKKYKSFEFPEDIKNFDTYAHSKYSAFFVETISKERDKFSEYIRNNFNEELKNLVLTHHNPQNEYGVIIQISDWIASSEREEDEEKKDFYVNVPLEAPFKRIDKEAEDLFYPLEDLSKAKPKREKNVDENKYNKLWEEFCDKFKDIKNFDQLITLFEFYFSNVPAQTSGFFPDISIFDHSRITSALSHLFYKNLSSRIISKEEIYKIRDGLKKRDFNNEIFTKPLFTLIMGDLSGIQNFIFNVSSEKAGRMLKGKSVYVDLLMRYVAKYLLDLENLTRLNSLFIGGGNFELLLPYISEERIEKEIEKITKTLWKLHGEDLYLAISWLHLSLKDIFFFISKKEELREKIDLKKKRKFKELRDFYDLVIKPKDEYIREREYCTICGNQKIEEVSSQDRWCEVCRSFVYLTDDLKNANYLVEEKINPINKDPKNIFELFNVLGYKLRLQEKADKNAKNYRLESLNLDKDFIPDGFLLGSFKLPNSDFENIAEKNIDKKNQMGDKKLSYLKMDADNMGKIFRILSQEEKDKEGESASLTRYGTLSRRIELFFGKEVLEMIKGKENIYPVFIGGDDLFLIGTYDEINRLALDIKNAYEDYTGSKNLFTISAGIYYFPNNFPLIRGARLVGEALERAKSFKYPEEESPKKGKIGIEDEILTYNEFEEALNISSKIYKKLTDNKEKSSRAIIFKIERSIKGFNPLLQASLKRKISPPLLWRFMYYLRDEKELAEYLSQILLKNVLDRGEKIRNPRLILVATKIARMKTKKTRGD